MPEVLLGDENIVTPLMGRPVEHPSGLGQALPPTVWLASRAAPGMVAAEAQWLRLFARGGVQRVVRLSALGAEPGHEAASLDWHGMADEQLRGSGLSWTIIRMHAPMQMMLDWIDQLRAEWAFYAPFGEGDMAMVDARDVARGAVKVLADDGLTGEVLEWTGPESVTFGTLAGWFEEVLDLPVAYVDTEPRMAREALLGFGWPEWAADDLVARYLAWREGLGRVPSRQLEKVVPDPTPVRRFLEDHRTAFLA